MQVSFFAVFSLVHKNYSRSWLWACTCTSKYYPVFHLLSTFWCFCSFPLKTLPHAAIRRRDEHDSKNGVVFVDTMTTELRLGFPTVAERGNHEEICTTLLSSGVL